MTEPSGLLKLSCSRLRNIWRGALNSMDTPVIVLCYHRVAHKKTDTNNIIVSPDNFRAQINHIQKNYPVARFEESWTEIKKPTIVITFDDGYADNLHTALPILKEAGVPATFFISTEQLGSRKEFWWDTLERIVMGDGQRPARFTLHPPGCGKSWPTATVEERMTLFRELHHLFMNGTAADRAIGLRQIGRWGGGNAGPSDAGGHLTVAELRTLAGTAGVTIGAHTLTHPRLATLSEERQRREIVESRRQLEKILGRKIEVFAYPFGKKSDFNGASVRICREAGYLRAAAAFAGEAHRWTDPHRIPRHFIHDWDHTRFAAYLKRFWI
jgi:peptidoglycan/xylan/chitin deacetylase (PgdA/CDA1 family)